jgi:hypothetical protein
VAGCKQNTQQPAWLRLLACRKDDGINLPLQVHKVGAQVLAHAADVHLQYSSGTTARACIRKPAAGGRGCSSEATPKGRRHGGEDRGQAATWASPQLGSRGGGGGGNQARHRAACEPGSNQAAEQLNQPLTSTASLERTSAEAAPAPKRASRWLRRSALPAGWDVGGREGARSTPEGLRPSITLRGDVGRRGRGMGAGGCKQRRPERPRCFPPSRAHAAQATAQNSYALRKPRDGSRQRSLAPSERASSHCCTPRQAPS